MTTPAEIIDDHFSAFASWTRFQALRARLDAIEPVKWTDQALQAFAMAQEAPNDWDSAETALALAMSQWNHSDARAAAAAELSKFLALPTPADAQGRWNLISPLTGNALASTGFEAAPKWLAAPRRSLSGLDEGQDIALDQWPQIHNDRAVFPGREAALALQAAQPGDELRESLSVAAGGPKYGGHPKPMRTFMELSNACAARLLGPAATLAETLSQGAISPRASRGSKRVARSLQDMVHRFEGPATRILNEKDENGETLLDQIAFVLAEGRSLQAWTSSQAPDAIERLKRLSHEAAHRSRQHLRRLMDAAMESRGGHGRFGFNPLEFGFAGDFARSRGNASLIDERLLTEVGEDLLLMSIARAWNAADDLFERELHDLNHGIFFALRGGDPRAFPSRDLERIQTLFEFIRAMEAPRHFEEHRLARRQGQLPAPLFFASPAQQQKNLPSLAAFVRMGADLAQDGASLAGEREAHWLASLGFVDEAQAMRESQPAPTPESLAIAATRKFVANQKAPSDAKIISMLCALDAPRPVEDIRQTLAAFGMGARELAVFADTPQGQGFAQCLALLVDRSRVESNRGYPALALALPLMLAFKRDMEDPAKTPHWRAPVDPQRAKALIEALDQNSKFQSTPSKGIQSLAAIIDHMGRATRSQGPWDAPASMGADDALQYLSARASEIGRQAGMLARRGLDLLEGRKPRDKAPSAPLGSSKAQGWDFPGGQWFSELPYEWAGDHLAVTWTEAGPACADGSALKTQGFAHALAKAQAVGLADPPRGKSKKDPLPEADPVRELLKAEGWAGEMALLAAHAQREPAALAPQASDRSKANAWLAEGKAAAKDWLGLTDAGWRLAQTHALARQELLKAAKSRAKRDRQAASKGLPPPPRDMRDRAARRWAELLNHSAARGLSAQAAICAALAFGPNEFGSGEFPLSWFAFQAVGPSLMRSGVALSQSIDSLGRELDASQALRPRWQGAMLSQAQKHLDALAPLAANATQAPPGNKIKASALESMAAQELSDQLQGPRDWANALAGRFYAQLPAKLDWKAIEAGSRRWHDEIARQAPQDQSGAAWDPIGFSWTSDDGVWRAKELLSPRELSAEGSAMHHCVGSYANHCRDGGSRIVSILKNGERSCTLELTTSHPGQDGVLPPLAHKWEIRQNRAHCNRDPEPAAKAAANAIREAAILASAKAAAEAKLRKEAAKPALDEQAMANLGDLELPCFDAAAALNRRRAQEALGGSTPKKNSP